MATLDLFEQLSTLRIVPVVVIDDAAAAEPLADALVAGGLPCAEVTFRTAAAQEAIAIMSRRGDMLVGAGTVLSIQQADAAIAAGAKFIVSPGTNANVVRHCLAKGVLPIPGVATPTEIQAAMELGLSVVKFFPAQAFGGLATLKAIAAPYKGVRFIPTGGIDEKNVQSYLAFKPVLACGGSWMVKSDLIAEGRFDEIRRLTAEAVSLTQLKA